MKMTFRWYGENDPVSLEYISQIPGMSGIVSAVYDVPVGEVWPEASIQRLQTQSAKHGLDFEVVESVPVHEDIKLGKPSRERYLENYKTNIRLLGKAGVKVICYNFMPVFDWLRTDLNHRNADGSTSLICRNEDLLQMDPKTKGLSLPGWDSSYTKDGLASLLAEYEGIDEEKLWENFNYFLDAIIPVCEECDVRMAIHPDDPPWSVFGLPRIIRDFDSLKKLTEINSSEYNGLTLCTGSLGCSPANDIPRMLSYFTQRKRIHFVHARNILINGDHCFNETAHLSSCGSLDMYVILKTLFDNGFDGYIRPDHGRMIWGETGKPGYGLFDRALGATYLNGLWEAISKAANGKAK